MTKADDAAARFNEGFSCSQAVVSSFAGDLGLDTDTAYRISCGFGAGIARTGNTCGAVAGVVMVIGLKYGKATTAGDDAAKERTYALVQEFITAFRAKNGSINCSGFSLSLSAPEYLSPEKLVIKAGSNNGKDPCPGQRNFHLHTQ